MSNGSGIYGDFGCRIMPDGSDSLKLFEDSEVSIRFKDFGVF